MSEVEELKLARKQARDYEKWENSMEGVIYRLEGCLVVPVATHETEDAEVLIAETLLKLPRKIRDRVLDPLLVEFFFMTGDTYGQIEQSYCPPHSEPKQGWRIFLNFPAMKRLTRAQKRQTIAHEIGHFIDWQRSGRKGSGAEGEMRADDLCEKWGFGRAYKSYKGFLMKAEKKVFKA